MKFSVVIPLYNKARYIACTLQSVSDQSYRDIEIIVVDDGSSDNGVEIVKSFDDPRIRLVQQPNAGVSAARNRGIDLARGEWVAFLDADDWLHPDFLATLLEVQQRFPKADALATEFLNVRDAEGQWPPTWPSMPNEPAFELISNLPEHWLHTQGFCSSSIAIRTRRLKHMQPCFAVGESHGEDLDLWCRLAERSTIGLALSPLSAYRVGQSESLSARRRTRVLAPFLHRMRARARTRGLLATPLARSTLWFVAHHEVTLAREALAEGRRIECLQWLFRGRRAAAGRRWWMTAVMGCLFSGQLAQAWQDWRIRRSSQWMGAVQAVGQAGAREIVNAGMTHD